MNHRPEVSTNLFEKDLLYLSRNQTEVTLSVPLNGEPEKVADRLQQLPPEAVQILTQAIAIWIGKNKSP
jgi:hypothetical protein